MRARAGQKLIVGPWTHMPWAPASVTNEGCGPGIVDDLQLRWFDQFLKGEETGVLDAPVTLFVMGAEEWRDYSDWPPPGSEPVRWFFHSKGRANSRFGDGKLSLDAPGDEPPDLFTADPMAPPRVSAATPAASTSSAPMGPADQRAAEEFDSVLVYTSDPLAEPMEWSAT